VNAAELVPLAIASAFWPSLLAVAIVSLRAAHPGRLLGSFLAGGLLATMSVGLVVIYALKGTAMTTTSRSSFSVAVYFTVGALALLSAFVLQRGYGTSSSKHEQEEQQAADKGPGRIERMLDKGTRLAFVAGIILCVFPGFFPLIALKDIAQLDYSVAATVVVLFAFYVVMFTLIEVPLVGFLTAPARTTELTTSFNVWLDRNARRLAVYALAGVGVLSIVRGVVELF
jgi:hypothetical protein